MWVIPSVVDLYCLCVKMLTYLSYFITVQSHATIYSTACNMTCARVLNIFSAGKRFNSSCNLWISIDMSFKKVGKLVVLQFM